MTLNFTFKTNVVTAVTKSYLTSGNSSQYSNASVNSSGGSSVCMVFNSNAPLPGSLPENIVSNETRLAFNYAVNVAALTVLFFVNVPSNVTNMIVFYQQGLRERINLCLFVLAFSDLMVVFLHFAWNVDELYAQFTGHPNDLVVMEFFVNNNIIVFAGFIYVSSVMSAIIAAERCFCIVSPFHSQHVIQTSTMAVILVVVNVAVLGGHYVISAKWQVICVFDPVVQVMLHIFFSSEFYLQNERLVTIFEGIIFGIVIPGICLLAVIVSTVVTIIKLKQLSAWREKSVSKAASVTSREVALTRMLVGTSIFFIVCTTPGFVFHTAIPFVPDLSLSGRQYNMYVILINIQQLFTYINCSFNFLIYYNMGSKYRETLRSMLGLSTLKTAHGPADQSMTTASNLDEDIPSSDSVYTKSKKF